MLMCLQWVRFIFTTVLESYMTILIKIYQKDLSEHNSTMEMVALNIKMFILETLLLSFFFPLKA